MGLTIRLEGVEVGLGTGASVVVDHIRECDTVDFEALRHDNFDCKIVGV